MIDFEQARRIAIAHIGPECGLIEEETFEKPYGWYFHDQSKAYLETGNEEHLLVGSGGFLVERENGRVVQFGSGRPAEQWLAYYEKGFKYKSYDLAIVSVRNLVRTIYFLTRLRMTYVVPELAHGTVWKIPKEFNALQLGAAIARPPHTFRGHSFVFNEDVFAEMDAVRCCVYRLSEHRPLDRSDTD